MNIKLSLVNTTAVAFGAALLMAGGVLSLLGVPGAKAETDANFNTIVDLDSARLVAPDPITNTHLSDRDLSKADKSPHTEASPSPAMPAATYQVTNINTSGPGSLYQAILNANANAGADTITFAANVSGTIVLTGSLPAIAYTLTIIGPGANTLAISGANAYGVFLINASTAVTITGLTIRDGNASGGGGINSAGTLMIYNTNIVSNTAGYGGGVYQSGSGRVDILNSLVEFNHSGYQGGGLFINGDAALTNTLVLTNTAGADGGGLTDWAGRTDLTGGMFAGNSAGGNGGGVNVNNSLNVNGTQFISNTANDSGGALLQWNAGYTVAVTNARFERNTAKNKGGGAFISSTLTLNNSTFVTNTVDSDNTNSTFGGGLYAGSAVQIFTTMFSGNAAYCNGCTYPTGGGLYSVGGLTVLTTVTFSGNQARGSNSGTGGGMFSKSGSLTMTNIIFNGNQVDGWGGGLADYDNNSTLSNVIFSGNKATWGGGIFNMGGNRTLINNTFSGNSGAGGGGIYSLGSSTSLVNSIVWGNGGDPQILGISGGTFAITYSDIQGTSVYTGIGNINANPQFVAPITATVAPTTTGNYRLLPASPAIDVGTNTGLTMDLDGVTRPQGNGYDMGAYEARISLGPCHAQLLSNSTTYTGTDAAAIQDAVDAAAPGDTVKVAGTCAGVQARAGVTQTVYLSKSLILRGGYTTTNWLTSYPIAYPTVLDAQQAGRVVNVTGGISINVTLENLTVRGGSTTSDFGSGVYNNGTLLLNNMSIVSNTSLAEGGGIFNAGTLTVTNSSVSSNRAASFGGGIGSSGGKLTLLNNTLSGNQVTGTVGGGGALDLYAGANATILNCTVVSNTAGTVSRSGIFLESNAGPLTIENSIVANNGLTNNLAISGTAFTSLGYNLTNSGAGTPFTTTGDLINTNALLGPLQNNGGSSWTHALLPGSPAIDRIPFGVSGCGISFTADQRGQPRPGTFTRVCDIGAYEAQGIHYQIYLPLVIKQS